MIYVITEDSNSARTFWNIVFETFNKEEYKLIDLPSDDKGKSYSGNKTLDIQVNNALKIMHRGDRLVIIFDNITDEKHFSTRSFLDRTEAKCEALGINLSISTYYCFEEIYLSYKELLNLYKRCKYNNIVLETLEFVCKSIHNRIDYFDANDTINNFISYYGKDSSYNREHFANALLMEVTKSLSKWFYISKSKDCFGKKGNGQCWLLNCTDIQSSMTTQHINHQCIIGCKYMCKNTTTRDKLLDLENKSLCRYTGLGLSGTSVV